MIVKVPHRIFYRMHRAYLKDRMCRQDKDMYEESLKLLLALLTDMKVASAELYDHISSAKEDRTGRQV